MVITTTVDIELLLGYLGNCWGWEWLDTPQYDTIVIFNILQYKYLNLSLFFQLQIMSSKLNLVSICFIQSVQ